MKQLVVPQVKLAVPDLEAALQAVFGPPMLRTVHGPATTAGPFDDKGKRAFKFWINVDRVPLPIRRFFCGTQLAVTTRQSLHRTPAKYTVTNRMKLHFVGAELFTLKPTFWLQQAEDGVSLGGCVRHSAILPPPLNGIAEDFMMLNSRRELLHFAACLRAHGLVTEVNST